MEEKLRALYKEQNIVAVVRSQRLRRMGQIWRMHKNRLKKLGNSKIAGSVRHGRPKDIWKKEELSDINDIRIKDWWRKEGNRTEWKKIVHEANADRIFILMILVTRVWSNSLEHTYLDIHKTLKPLIWNL